MLVKWDPFTELERTLNWWGGRPYARPVWDDRNSEAGHWFPPVNVYEDNDYVYYDLQLPGIDMKDVNISVIDQVLQIRGERKADTEKQEEGYHVKEATYGTFFRSFTLPTHVNADQAKAKYDKGVLSVVIPKQEKVKPRLIPIEVE
ncbi:MAG: Hsp20 family protein [Nitrospirales bacterium]|nr:Hsp20 family protein [Nitrospirales bacterium]